MQRSLERRAQERAEWLSRRIGREIATARRAHGWSQRELARRAGVSQAAVSRAERGSTRCHIGLLSLVCMTSGMELSVRAFVGEDAPLRDERQLALIDSIVKRLPAAWHVALEVRVGDDPRDHRAIDAVVSSAVEVCAVEVERDLSDFQAQLRADLAMRDLLQRRETRPVRFVLAIPDTRRLRAVVRAHQPAVLASFPITSRRAWAALRTGRPIGGDALLWLPPVPALQRAP
ncbi:MAG TPA: helix-turn-helix transcriptional regulator [Candidatus Limnocylindria bacterium]|jgi:transcriptional regulator with XRE-family HTH domain|nr:helix-turn-helix transcriptional regulator [Candidatus Limnocylindria bacterium]